MKFCSQKILSLYTIITLFCISTTLAQDTSIETPPFTGCFFDEKHQETFKNDEKYRENVLNFENFYQQRLNAIASGEFTNFATEVTIPVVVHIIHLPGTPVGTAENLSLAQIEAGIEHLNQGFRNTGDYAGDSRLAAANAALASADIQLNFCLAKRDPNGNATNGINRVASSLSNVNPELSSSSSCREDQDGELKDLSRWDPTKYLNVWLVKGICTTSSGCGVAGYAYLSGAHGQCYDGVVNEASYWGSSTDASKVHIHEVGHYFNLSHTFNVPSGESSCQNNDCSSDGDFVCDTPPDSSTSGVSCGDPQNSCSTDANSGFSSDVEDMYENYMDYSRQSCQNTFTEGQKTRMRAALDGSRASLKTSDGCTEVTGNFAFFKDVSTGAYESNATTVSGCRKYYDLTIPIALYKTAGSASTVTITIDGASTANTPGDVELISSTTVNFATSESSKDITVRVYNDEISESTETFILTISNVTGEASAAAFNQTHTVEIINNSSGGASFSGSGNVTAEAGNAALNLSLSPVYGSVISNFSGSVTSSDPGSNLAFENGNPSSCAGPSNSNYYDTYTFTAGVTGNHTFTISPYSGLVVNIYEGTFDPSNICTGFIGSTGTRPSGSGNVNLSNQTTVSLVANTSYSIAITSFSTSYPTLPQSYTVTSGETIYDGVPDPGASYTYTYMAVNASGVISAISASADFTGLSAGTYTVYGVTLLTSDVSNFNSYLNTNISAIYSGSVCPTLSVNTITLTVTAPACTNPTPTLGTPTNPTTCGGNQGSIPINNLTANTAYTLSYKKDGGTAITGPITTNGSGSYTLANLEAGVYSEIKVTISTCTSANLSTTLTGPTGSTAAVMSGGTTICNGASANISVAITGGTSPYTLVHSGGTVNNYVSGTAIVVSPSSTTSFTITSVTDANGCVGTNNSGTATITVNQASTAAVMSGSTTICNGESANISVAITGGTSPYTLVHSGGTVNNYVSGTAIAVSPSSMTSYTITSVTDANGCVGTNNSGTATITVQDLPNVNAITSQTVTTGSMTTAITFSGTGSSYTWTNDNTNIGLGDASGMGNIPAFEAMNAGVATITVTPVLNGCNGATKTFTITVSASATCTNDMLNVDTSNDNATYSCDTVSSAEVIPSTHTVTYEGCKEVILKTGFHAAPTSSATFTARIVSCNPLTNPENNVSQARINTQYTPIASNLTMTIRPNPAKEYTTIDYQLKEAATVSIRLFDMTGKELAIITSQQAKAQGTYQQEVALSGFNAGMYFVVLQTEKEQISKKMILIR